MGILKTLHSKQVHNGIFIALLVVFAAGIVAWWYSNSDQTSSPDTLSIEDKHPLAQAKTVSLCALLPKYTGTVACQDSDQQPNIAGHSVWTDKNNISVLRIDLISTLNLSVSEPVTSRAWLENVIPEIKASGRDDWDEPKGEWSRAAITRKDTEQELLFEDNGIVIVMQSDAYERPALLKFAHETLNALRKAKAVTSSADAATRK